MPNDNAQAQEGIRHKISTYMELKKLGKVVKMGTTIQNRHRFFQDQETEGFVEDLEKILHSTEKNNQEKFEELIQVLETMWTTTVDNFLDESTGLKKFELEIDHDKFSCVLIGPEAQLCDIVVEYFIDMLNTKASNPSCRTEYERVELELFNDGMDN